VQPHEPGERKLKVVPGRFNAPNARDPNARDPNAVEAVTKRVSLALSIAWQ
jgi:hypothetical protein